MNKILAILACLLLSVTAWAQTPQNITASGQRIQWDVASWPNVNIMEQGTFAGVNVTFEGGKTQSDGSVAWVTVDAVRSTGGTVESTSGALSAAPAYSWDVASGGYDFISVRSTALVSGTAAFQVQGYRDGVSKSGAVTLSGTGAVNVTQVAGAAVKTGAGTASGSVRVELPTDGTGKVGLNAGTAQIGHVVLDASTTGGWGSFYSANVTNAAVAVDAAAGQVGGYYFYNANSSVCYVQWWNTAQGSVVVGTTAPVLSMGIPANGGANLPAGAGLTFTTAITIAATTTRAGLTACTSGIDVNIWYQ